MEVKIYPEYAHYYYMLMFVWTGKFPLSDMKRILFSVALIVQTSPSVSLSGLLSTNVSAA